MEVGGPIWTAETPQAPCRSDTKLDRVHWLTEDVGMYLDSGDPFKHLGGAIPTRQGPLQRVSQGVG
jgi:hypothetical protein